LFGDDTEYGRRLAIAFAIAIALHELAAAFFHSTPAAKESPERISVAFVAHIERRPTPSPRPIVHITPRVISTPHVQIVPNPAPAAPKRAALKEGAAKSIAHTVHHAPRIAHIAVPRIARGGAGLAKRAGGTGAGGTSRGTGTGAGGQGTGTGAGGRGNGNGTYASANEPCGYVEFVPNAEPIYDKSTGAFRETIKMTVHYPDGHDESTRLDWLWYYPNEAADPWSEQNIRLHPNAPVPFQPPPSDKAGGEPPIVQYVVQHSTPDGLTLLKDCPPTRGG
jgi:hypothetical protein